LRYQIVSSLGLSLQIGQSHLLENYYSRIFLYYTMLNFSPDSFPIFLLTALLDLWSLRDSSMSPFLSVLNAFHRKSHSLLWL
jgi:hypothetical protein